MGQCLGPRITRQRESDRTHRQQNLTQNGPNGGKVGPDGKRSSELPYHDTNKPLEEALRKIRIGHTFQTVKSAHLPGLATSSHVELSIFSTKERGHIEETHSRTPAVWNHQVCHDSMGNGVTYQLWIRPFVGPFADSILVFLLECEADGVADFVVKGMEEEEMAMIVPQTINTLTHFLSLCLQMTFSTALSTRQVDVGTEEEWLEEDNDSNSEDNNEELLDEVSTVSSVKDVFPPSLLFFSQRAVICHLHLAKEVSSSQIPLPLHIRKDIFGEGRLITVNVSLWPQKAFVPSTSILIQEGMLSCEFAHILRKKVGIPPQQNVVLYHKFQGLQGYEELTSECTELDCFLPSPQEEVGTRTISVVLSLVGFQMSDITVSPSMKMKEFDLQVRREFGLSEDSFLVFLPDGHYTPPYTTSSGWKCVHPFSIQNIPRGNSFSRSFRQRRSFTGHRQVAADNRFDRANPVRRSLYAPRDAQSQGRRGPTTNQAPNEVAQQAENTAIKILSTGSRHFPSKTRGDNEFGIPMYRVYHEMSMYQLTLEQYGITSHSILQVYEVTGPAVPITSRTDQHLSLHQKQRGNLMDVNPQWSLFTFAHYFDAMMSPSAIYLDKEIACGKQSICVSESPDLTLKSLFEDWQPLWWGEEKEMTRKELLLNPFLSVQNVSDGLRQN